MVELDSSQLNAIVIANRLQENGRYALTLLPGAVTDIYNQSNTDTLKTNFRVLETKSLGILSLDIKGLDTNQVYLMRLVKGNNRDLIRSFTVSSVEQTNQRLIGLPAATYQLEIITDWNRNGRFDGGDYDLQRLPEPVATFPIEALRANWEVAATINLN